MSRVAPDTPAPASPASPREVRCRVCGSADVTLEDPPYFHTPTVASVPIELSDLDLMRCRCNACTYQFVHPPIPQERLIQCYRQAPGRRWSTEPSTPRRRLFDEKRRLLQTFSPGRRIVDFGCADGGFLTYLGKRFDTAGIEPNASAADLARANGITIIAPTVQQVDLATIKPFDAVVAFDVFEHLIDPVDVLRNLRGLLNPGGIVMIETGNTDTPLWKKFGRLFPYCVSVEHVGFFNERSLRAAGRLAGMELVHFKPSVHTLLTPWEHLFNQVYYRVFRVGRALDAWEFPLPARWRRRARGCPPRLPQIKDHFLAILRLAN